MERSAIQESARQRKETETAPPLSILRLYLPSPDSAPLHPGYVAADPELKELVWREFMMGVEQDRVTAIPTMFVGERHVVEGALSLDCYRRLFDSVLAEAQRSISTLTL